MAVYYKPQSPIQSGEDFIYPITTADQVKVDKDTRLNAVGVYLKNIDNSTDTTVYGNNATTLGSVAAEDYALKTDTAPDSSKLGGKAPEYYIQPRNLLDNSDFRNPVNQRGQTSYTGGGYSIDRWVLGINAVVVNVLDDGIEVTGGDSTYNAPYIQKVPENLTGKTVTLAVCDSDGVIETVTGTVQTDSACSTNTTYGNITFYHASSDGTLWVQINVKYGGSKIFRWAALYEGSYTADTLPPYVPKGYAAELAECQRYYEFVGINKYSIGRIGEVYFGIQFTQKRTNPTVTIVLEVASNNITNRGEVWNANRVSVGGLLYYANDANLSYWYGSAVVSADL